MHREKTEILLAVILHCGNWESPKVSIRFTSDSFENPAGRSNIGLKDCLSLLSWSIVCLQQTLNNQELSAADVERMKHEKRELQKAIEQLEKERDYFDQQIWEKEMQYAKKHEEVSLEQQKYSE